MPPVRVAADRDLAEGEQTTLADHGHAGGGGADVDQQCEVVALDHRLGHGGVEQRRGSDVDAAGGDAGGSQLAEEGVDRRRLGHGAAVDQFIAGQRHLVGIGGEFTAR